MQLSWEKCKVNFWQKWKRIIFNSRLDLVPVMQALSWDSRKPRQAGNFDKLGSPTKKAVRKFGKLDTKMATSSSSTSSFSTYQHKSDRHFNYENWPSLSFLEDLDEEDVEVTKASAFDPVVGKGRTQSTRSSSARSSGSTGFYESVEMSPTNSLSPHAFVSLKKRFCNTWRNM